MDHRRPKRPWKYCPWFMTLKSVSKSLCTLIQESFFVMFLWRYRVFVWKWFFEQRAEIHIFFTFTQNMAHLDKNTHTFVILDKNCHFCHENIWNFDPTKSDIFCIWIRLRVPIHYLEWHPKSQNVTLCFLAKWIKFCILLMKFQVHTVRKDTRQ